MGLISRVSSRTYRRSPTIRATIRDRHCEDKALGERRISNINRIKGLERKLGLKDQENEQLKHRLAERDFQYTEMKKRAMGYKQRLAMNVGMGMPMYQPNMGQFLGFPPQYQQTSLPRSISNETIICPQSVKSAS